MFIPDWAIFDEGIWIPTERVKGNIGFHGFVRRSRFRTEDKILIVFNRKLRGHIIYNMFYDTNPKTTFFKLFIKLSFSKNRKTGTQIHIRGLEKMG